MYREIQIWWCNNQYLSKDLDNGPILPCKQYHSNPFIYTMLSVKSAIIAKKHLKQKKSKTNFIRTVFFKINKKKVP